MHVRPNSLCTDQVQSAERELAAFIGAVTELFGAEQARLSAQYWLGELEWINDGNFIGIGGERDPIIGLQEESAIFTIPRDPVRQLVRGIETFKVLRGGEYFFMPSLSALKWLADAEN